MTHWVKRALLGTSALTASLIGSAAAFAQVETITVTAQRREQTLQETPVAVSAVTDDQLERSQIRDVRDLQLLVPSLRVGQFASSTNVEISIRGLGTSSFNPGLEPSVGVFVDGVYLARQGAAINDFLSLERVEVLRGPQSTLFGRNTPAGVVSFITRAPEYDFGYDAEATVGNYNARVLRGTVTAPIIDDTLAFRLDGNWNQRDGFVDNIDGRDLNNRNRYSLRGQLLFEPNSNLSLRFIADTAHTDEDCCAAPFLTYAAASLGAIPGLGGTLLPADPFARQTAIDGLVNTELNTGGASFHVDWDLGFATLSSITAYRSYDENQDIDADFTDLDLAGRRVLDQDYRTVTQEFRLTSNGDGPVGWQAGFYYYDQELGFTNNTPYGSQLRPFADLLTGGGITAVEGITMAPAGAFLAGGQGLIEEDYDLNTQSWSLFGQVDWHVTDRLTLTGGLRYSAEEKDIDADILIIDPFSSVNLFTVGGQVIFAQAFGLLTGGLPPTPANIAANPAEAAQAQAAAAAGAGDPGVNPLLGLLPLQFNPPASDFTDSREEDNVSGTFIISYDVSDDLNVYGSYSRGYKAGGFNVSANASLTGVFEFQPEISESYELGVKATVFGGTTRINTALFYQTLEDFQANIFTGTGFGLQNAGEVELSGLEVEFVSQPSDRFLFTGGFTYMFQSEYASFLRNACYDNQPIVPGVVADPSQIAPGTCGLILNNVTGLPETLQNSSGETLSGAAEFVGSLTGTYFHPIGTSLEGFLRGEVFYTSSRNLGGDLDPRREQDGFTLFNASVGIGSVEDTWQLQFWGRNIFEEDYQQGNFTSVGQPGSLNAYPSDPRTYGVTLRVRN